MKNHLRGPQAALWRYSRINGSVYRAFSLIYQSILSRWLRFAHVIWG